ncbi:hypothetical protein AB6A40_011323, partial [Gnathostoma spinigerum]
MNNRAMMFRTSLVVLIALFTCKCFIQRIVVSLCFIHPSERWYLLTA